jgi:hypothetical protein
LAPRRIDARVRWWFQALEECASELGPFRFVEVKGFAE